MDKETREIMEKKLVILKEQRPQVEAAFHQIIGQIALLEELLKEEKK
jgi:hypothetical protein